MQVTFDKNSLIVDGKRVFIRSGAFHYFRTPGVELALDRFSKIKAAGYNTVDIYFNWGYHSQSEGEYDFSGIKDVRKVLQAVHDCGLFVIARPGPFINAEINAGGLPFWLLTNKDVIPRNRKGIEYCYSPEYMKFVTQWYDQIIPIITEFDNIILFQIENEYASDTMDEGYMKELYQMARERGITCPIFHNDSYNAGLWADVVDIYASDIYPYISPNQEWKKDHFCFDTLDNIEDTVRSFKEDSPIFIAEMQGGWFDKWNGIGYKAMREALGDEHINIMTKTAISQGVTIFNHYMATGGTSWDNLACDEVYTSYDFCSGIDEFGNLQPNFYKAKAINYFLNSFGLGNTQKVEGDVIEPQEAVYAVRRKDYENNGNWLFVRNLNPNPVSLSIHDSPFTIHQFDMKIMPENLPLYACTIEFSDVEIFARLRNEKDEVLFMLADKDANLYLDIDCRKEKISGDKKDYEHLKFEKDGKTTQFVFLTPELAKRTWVLDDKIIFNADFVYPNGKIALEKTTEVAYFDTANGFSKKYFKYQEKPKTITLKDFDVNFCAPEIDMHYDYSGGSRCEPESGRQRPEQGEHNDSDVRVCGTNFTGAKWIKVSSKAKLDCFSVGLYDEFIWYKAKIPNNLEEITLSAIHLFAVYINGKEILNRNSYKYEKLQQIEETLSIPLDKLILNKDENELTILVQNLGFDKGFSGETNNPRGLVEFSTKPECNIDFYIKEGLAPQNKELTESESPYMAKLSTTFDIEFKENVVKSMYLSLEGFAYDRATIFLNGVKIGRYMKSTSSQFALQEKFYLINTFLKEHNTLDIIIWEKASNIKTPWDFKFELKYVTMSLGDEKVYQLY